MERLREFFTTEDEQIILAAIQKAEKHTSGEIRLRIEGTAGKKPMKTARKAFEALGMRETEQKNGVLFYLSLEDRQFVILGDDGINAQVPEDFWKSVKDTVIDEFKEGRFAAGLAIGIELAGRQLAEYFPYDKDDVDELPNAISFADEGGEYEAQ